MKTYILLYMNPESKKTETLGFFRTIKNAKEVLKAAGGTRANAAIYRINILKDYI